MLVLLVFYSCQSARENNQEMRSYQLAMIQMEVVGGAPEINLCNAELKIREAAEHGAKFALLPEAMDFGWTHTSARKAAGTSDGIRLRSK